ncbi:MAG: hypothetical protein U9Q18_06385 [Caldisericota bacterium]|nr:hypothetical protein [Caldisericota bacterium]
MIIVVTGNGSNSGKTTLIRVILSLYPGIFDVVKLTPSDKLKSAVEVDESELLKDNKDTAFFIREGARKVVWIHGKAKDIGSLLKSSLTQLGDNIIIEGNSALRCIKPNLIFFVARDRRSTVNKSAAFAESMADYIILNKTSGNYNRNGNILNISLRKALADPGKFVDELSKILQKFK